MIVFAVDQCGQIDFVFYTKVGLMVLKISDAGAAKASAFRMTALNLDLPTPIIINETQSLPLSIDVV